MLTLDSRPGCSKKCFSVYFPKLCHCILPPMPHVTASLHSFPEVRYTPRWIWGIVKPFESWNAYQKGHELAVLVRGML